MQFKPPQGRITRANFEREFHLMVEQLEQGRLKVSSASSFNSILTIQKVPNRRINLNTINGGARAMAMMTTSYAERGEQDFVETPDL